MNNILVLAFLTLCPSIALSYQTQGEKLTYTSDRCLRHFVNMEKHYNIPLKLLKSISLTESGRYNRETGEVIPWPWAVNNAGKSYYFSTKSEAIRAVQEMQNKGITNIDVGCMQINLGYHGKKFKSLNHAFEPKHNIEFAAGLLRMHYFKYASWAKSIAAYHSRSSNGIPYYKKVLLMWNQEISNSRKSSTFSKDNNIVKRFNHQSPRMRPERLKSNLIVE